jgi:YihY family inner membrane protein
MGSTGPRLLNHPLAFAWATAQVFYRNQGLLLAGAIAYYALLSLVPLLILLVVGLSHLVDQDELLTVAGRLLEWLVPSQSQAVLADVAGFVEHEVAIGAVLLVTLLFFSSLAFSILEKAMAVIFAHRGLARPRHALVSVILPYGFVLVLSVALLFMTVASIVLQSLARESVQIWGTSWSLLGLSGLLLYLLGLAGEVIILTIFYMVLPVGRTRVSHALLGAVATTAIWDLTRHGLVWYLATLSRVNVVYGSLSSAVVMLLAMEIAAILLLYGAQVISEYEKLILARHQNSLSP